MTETEESKAPSLPADDKAKAGRPTKAEMDKRADALDVREQAISAAERQLQDAQVMGVDPNPAPITPVMEGREHKAETDRQTAQSFPTGKKFPDMRPYLAKYPDQRMMWVNDMSGDVQRWIDLGADPVPVMVNAARTFEGLTDTHESKWTRVIGGPNPEGGPLWVYLLMMSEELYDSIKLAPLRQRQAAIRDKMKRGNDQSDGAGGELQSYAPHLPTGGMGFEQLQEHMQNR